MYCEFRLKWPLFKYCFLLKKRPFQSKIAESLTVCLHSQAVAGSAAACWFKTSSHGPARPLPGAVSGAVGGPAPPPPPPKPCNRWLTPAEASADKAAYLLSFSAVCFMTVRDIARMHTHNRPMGLIQAA